MLYKPDCKIYSIKDINKLCGTDFKPIEESRSIFNDKELFVLCREIPKYKGECDTILISNYGRIFSCGQKVFINTMRKNGRYRVVYASQGNGKRKAFYVHRLVAKYFVAGYEPDLKIKFIDNDTTNVASYNLMWVTNWELSIINSIMNNPSEENMRKKISNLMKEDYKYVDIVNLLYQYIPGRNYATKNLYVRKLMKNKDTDN